MRDPVFEQLDFSRYARWTRRITGNDYAFASCDASGQLIWTDSSGEMQQRIEQVNANGFAWPCSGKGMQRHECGDDAAMFYVPVESRLGLVLGYLVLLARDGEYPADLDGLAEALEDAVASIVDEYSMKADLDLMADELAERYEELHLVYAIDQQVRNMKDGGNVFSSLLQSCASHMNVDIAAFVTPKNGSCIHATNLSKPVHNLDLVLVEMRGDLFRFAHSGRKTIVLNAMDDPRRAYIFTDMPFKILCCPVYEDNMVTSIVVLANHEHKPDFSNSDRKMAEVMANQLSTLSRLFGMVTAVSKFNDQMASALIEAVEAKDPYTRGHSERVHHISMEIGRAMDLSAVELENLFWGSLLHDVGKIGVPDAVLCKPARLTEDEYTFIKVHPERSYEILRHIERFKGAVPGARFHQEKFDGTGYPHGLRGSDIPLNARIIAVADTYDSITSSRAYRAGRSHEAAMRETERVTGTQLDPKIVDCFKKVCAANPEWMERFGIRRENATQGVSYAGG